MRKCRIADNINDRPTYFLSVIIIIIIIIIIMLITINQIIVYLFINIQA